MRVSEFVDWAEPLLRARKQTANADAALALGWHDKGVLHLAEAIDALREAKRNVELAREGMRNV